MSDRRIQDIYTESLKFKQTADEYCKSRGLENPDFGYLRFLQYQKRVLCEVIVIPIRDARGKLVMLELRSIKFKEHYKLVEDNTYHIYNIQKAIYNTDYVILTEGVFDAESLIQNGFNAVATMTASIPTATKHILNVFDNLILAYDNDSAGVRAMKELADFYHENYIEANVNILDYEGKDINEVLQNGGFSKVLKELEAMTA